MSTNNALEEAARLAQSGQFEAAASKLEALIEAQHDDAVAHCLLGQVYMQQGRHEDAGDCYALALCFRPDYAEAHRQAGLLAFTLGDWPKAQEALQKAVALDPGNPMILNDLGATLFKQEKLHEAADAFRRVLELAPQHVDAHSNLGYLLAREFEQFDEGRRHIEEALRLAPTHSGALSNWTMILHQQGRWQEALELCDALIARGINAEGMRLNRALVLLTLGDFERGWPDYEMRKRVRSNYMPRHLPYPEWTGQSLSGRTVLVHAEQGMGDQIMFASCVSQLAALAGRCILECDPKLLPIFARSFPGIDCYAQRSLGEGDWMANGVCPDFQVGIGSLPLHFRRSLESFARHSGYLHADAAGVRRWRERLEALPGQLKVGISWRGGMKSTRSSLRSASLGQWLPIFNLPGVDYVSLQYTECQAELSALATDHGVSVHHWQEAIDDYDETAALVGALDLVISVQTAVVHLAGALGKPVWAMIPIVPEWRYQHRGETLPWYPSLRMFRQQDSSGWAPVIERIANELEQRLT